MVKLICIYNANSGLFNGIMDSAHKAFSPETYQCELCALTHGYFGMRKEWKRYTEEKKVEIEYLHKDDIQGKKEYEPYQLPVILKEGKEGAELLLGKAQLSRVQSISDLINLLESTM